MSARQPAISPRPQEPTQPPTRLEISGTTMSVLRKPIAQRAIVLLVLGAVAVVEYYLVNVPVADVERTGRISPAQVKAADQAVSFLNPETEADRFSFTYVQAAESTKQRMLVDAYFDKASLSEDTLQRMSALGIHAPSGPAAISYLTTNVHNSSCSTMIQVDTLAASGGTRVVQFSQGEFLLSDRHRMIEVKMAGLDSTIVLSSRGSFTADTSSPCRIKLAVGGWEQLTQGFLDIKLRVPAGSSYRFRWEASEIQPSGWSVSGTPVSLLLFGSQPKQSFKATEVRIVPAQALPGRSGSSGLIAISEQKGNPLTVDSLLVGTDRLEVTASGRGRVFENGKVISKTNILEAIKQYPLISALLGMVDFALLDWARRKFFPAWRLH